MKIEILLSLKDNHVAFGISTDRDKCEEMCVG